MMPARILFADREKSAISRAIGVGSRAGLDLQWTGPSGLPTAILETRPEAIVVGQLNENQCRVDLCRDIRAVKLDQRPALIVAVPLSATLTRVKCLEAGADSVIEMPWVPGQLAERLHTLTRSREIDDGVLQSGAIEMRTEELKVLAAGRAISLSPSTFQLLRIFIERRGEIMSRNELLLRLFGPSQSMHLRAIDSAVRRLRGAMACVGLAHAIVTVRSAGYMLVA